MKELQGDSLYSDSSRHEVWCWLKNEKKAQAVPRTHPPYLLVGNNLWFAAAGQVCNQKKKHWGDMSLNRAVFWQPIDKTFFIGITIQLSPFFLPGECVGRLGWCCLQNGTVSRLASHWLNIDVNLIRTNKRNTFTAQYTQVLLFVHF